MNIVFVVPHIDKGAAGPTYSVARLSQLLANFHSEPALAPVVAPETSQYPFRFIYVGLFIRRQQFELLAAAVSMLLEYTFELWVVGAGKFEGLLCENARRMLPTRVRWFRSRPSTEVRLWWRTWIV